MKGLALILALAAAASGACAQGVMHGNGAPDTLNPPANCAFSRFYVDDATGQMYQAATGSPCSWVASASLHSLPSCPVGSVYSQCPSNLAFSGWAFNNASGTAQGYFAPDGTTNALLMVEDGTTNEHYDITGPVAYSWAAGATHTYTLYARRVVGTRNMQMQLSLDGFTNTASIGIDLGNCSTAFGPNISGDVTATGSASPVYPDWCKVALNVTAAGAHTAYYLDFSLISRSTKVYAGDSASTNAYWGLSIQ